jgi:hypothetical protein
VFSGLFFKSALEPCALDCPLATFVQAFCHLALRYGVSSSARSETEVMLASLTAISLIMLAYSVHPAILIPLVAACFAIVLLVPIGAFQGMLHIPAYCGLALLAFAFGLIVGKVAGTQIPGSFLGVALSIVFFLAMAASLGSILAIFVYRQRQG